VAAGALFTLEKGEIGNVPQSPGTRETRNPRSDYSNAGSVKSGRQDF